MTLVRVPFGLAADGRVYSPLEVQRGKACGCVCPGCKESLIARLPRASNRTPHFAHAPGADCAKGFETAVHLAAKQLISEEKALYFPQALASLVEFDALGNRHARSRLIEKAGVKSLSAVRVEQSVADLRPDVIVSRTSEAEVYVEIAVTHFVDQDKRSRLAALRCPTIEFDLSAHRDFTWDSLKALLIGGNAPCVWVCHPQMDEQIAAWRSELAPIFQAAKVQAAARDERERAESEQKMLEAARRQQLEQQLQQQMQRKKQEKAQKFKALPLIDKVALVCRSFGVWKMPAYLRIQVDGERSFGVTDPLIWQAMLFRVLIQGAIHQGCSKITKKSALDWLAERFEFTPAFKDSQAIAVWKYLCGLGDRGALRREPHQEFSILVANLSAFETLQAYASGQVTAENGLIWAAREHWPTRSVVEILAENHAAMRPMPSIWRAPSTLLHSVSGYPVDEVLARYSHAIPIEKLAVFWISAGFLVRTTTH